MGKYDDGLWKLSGNKAQASQEYPLLIYSTVNELRLNS